MWPQIAIFVVSTIISMAMAPKPPRPKAASLEDFDLPTADESRDLSVLFGTVEIKDGSVEHYGGLAAMPVRGDGGMFSSNPVIGYRYSLDMLLAFDYGPVDEVTQIRFGERVAWAGSNSGGQITVDAEELFGGERSEGGVVGLVDVMMGESSQPVNGYLQAAIGGTVPAFRGVVTLLFRHFYIGTSPYLKALAVTMRRTDVLDDGADQWNLAKSRIGDDLNAIHLVREVLTNRRWGMGYPVSAIDDANFLAAASTCFDEGFGLSMRWTSSVSIESFLQQVMDHINGILLEDPTAGLFQIKLVRDDYAIGDLPVFDPSNVMSLDQFERRGWGETTNQVTAVYRDQATGQDAPVIAQNIGSIQAQGAVVNQTLNYPGISNAALAQRVALRDLATLSAALSALTITVNRTAHALGNGDLFVLNWPKLGLDQVVYRATGVDLGQLARGKIVVSAVEDIFGLPAASYTEQQPSGWVDPIAAPVAASYQRVTEASYWQLLSAISPADIALFDPDFGFLMALVQRPSAGSYDYQLITKVGGDSYAKRAVGQLCPTVLLVGALGLTDTVISYSDPVDLDWVQVDSLAYLGDELLAIKAIDTGALTVTVARGVLDAVPQPHADSERLWFADNSSPLDPTVRVSGAVIDAKMLPSTGLGTLPEADASAESLTLNRRYRRPYAPGNIRANGVAYGATTSGDINFSWAHRDRTQQTSELIGQGAASIGPEAGVSYTVRLYEMPADTLRHTESGMTSDNWSYTQAARLVDFGGAGPHSLRVEIEAVRDGFASWQAHSWAILAADV